MNPILAQPTCNVSFHSFQGVLARIIAKFNLFWIVIVQFFQRVVYESECKNMSEVSRASAAASNFGAKMR